MIDPFRKCKYCDVGVTCSDMRRDLVMYLRRDGFPRTGAKWPWDWSRCPECELNPKHFKTIKNCPMCKGEGIVGMRRVRGTGQEGPDDVMDLGEMLVRLDVSARNAVERWIKHAGVGTEVKAERWMKIERGWKKKYDEELGVSVAFLNRPWKIAEYYIRTKDKRRPTRRAIKYFERSLERGLRYLAMEYGRKLYERIT